MSWLSRVPLTIGEAKKVLREVEDEMFEEGMPGYKVVELGNMYGGVKQRWVVVLSEERKRVAGGKFERQLKKEEEKLEKQLKKLSKESYSCEKDARKALGKIEKGTKELTSGYGQFKKEALELSAEY